MIFHLTYVKSSDDGGDKGIRIKGTSIKLSGS